MSSSPRSRNAMGPFPPNRVSWWTKGSPDLSYEEAMTRDVLAAIDDFVDLPEAERTSKPLPVTEDTLRELLAEKRPVLAPDSVRSFTWAACLRGSHDGEVLPPVLVSTQPGFQDVYPKITRKEIVGDICSTFNGYELGGDPNLDFHDQIFAEEPKDSVEIRMTKLLPENEDEQQDWHLANVSIYGHIACRFRAKDGGVRVLWVGETFDATDRFQACWQRCRFDHHVRSALRYQLLLKEAANYVRGARSHAPLARMGPNLLEMEGVDMDKLPLQPVTLGAVLFSPECAISLEETSICGLDDFVTFSNHDDRQVSNVFLRRNVVLPLLDSACLAGSSSISFGVQEDEWIVTCKLMAGTSAQLSTSERGVVWGIGPKPCATFSAYSALCAVVRDCKKLNIAVRVRSEADTQDPLLRCVSISIPFQTKVSELPPELELTEGKDRTKQDRRGERPESPRKAKRPRQVDSEEVRPLDPSSFAWVLIEDQRVLALLQRASLAKHFGIKLNVIQSPEEISRAPEAILKIFAEANENHVVLLMDENLYTVGNDAIGRVPYTATQIRDELFRHAHVVEAVETKKLVLVAFSTNPVLDNRIHVHVPKTVPTPDVVKTIMDIVSPASYMPTVGRGGD